MKPGLGLTQPGERLVGTWRGPAVPCRAGREREREGSKGHPSVPHAPQPPWGTAGLLFFGMLAFVGATLPPNLSRGHGMLWDPTNTAPEQSWVSPALAASCCLGTLAGPCHAEGMLPPSPWARAQQHLGMLRVKVEEGQETFVQLPQHFIWDCSRGEVNTGNVTEPTLVSGTISASGQGRYLPLLPTTRLSHKVYNQI